MPFWKPRQFARDGVQDATLLLQVGKPRPRVGALRGAEQPLEEGPRIVLHRDRRCRVLPRDGVPVGAAVPLCAGPEHFVGLDPDLERIELRLLAEFPRGDLIERRAGLKIRTFGRLAFDPGQPCALKPRMRAAILDVGMVAAEPCQDERAIPHGLQWTENRGQPQGPLGVRYPLVEVHPHRDIERAKAPHWLSRRAPQCRERGHHAVEQGERNRDPQAAQHGTPRQVLLGDDHDSAFLI